MMRETLAANSTLMAVTLATLAVEKRGGACARRRRQSQLVCRGNEFTWVPVWYKLERAGNTFTASQSLDGVTWFVVGKSTVQMANAYFVGYAGPVERPLRQRHVAVSWSLAPESPRLAPARTSIVALRAPSPIL